MREVTGAGRVGGIDLVEQVDPVGLGCQHVGA